eukprot:g1580.t1
MLSTAVFLTIWWGFYILKTTSKTQNRVRNYIEGPVHHTVFLRNSEDFPDIVILAPGGRGEVERFIEVALLIKYKWLQEGFQKDRTDRRTTRLAPFIRIAAFPEMANLVRSNGMGFYPLPFNTEKWANYTYNIGKTAKLFPNNEGQQTLLGSLWRAATLRLIHQESNLNTSIYKQTRYAPKLIIANFLSGACPHFGDALNINCVISSTFPITPTAYFPPPLVYNEVLVRVRQDQRLHTRQTFGNGKGAYHHRIKDFVSRAIMRPRKKSEHRFFKKREENIIQWMYFQNRTWVDMLPGINTFRTTTLSLPAIPKTLTVEEYYKHRGEKNRVYDVINCPFDFFIKNIPPEWKVQNRQVKRKRKLGKKLLDNVASNQMLMLSKPWFLSTETRLNLQPYKGYPSNKKIFSEMQRNFLDGITRTINGPFSSSRNTGETSVQHRRLLQEPSIAQLESTRFSNELYHYLYIGFGDSISPQEERLAFEAIFFPMSLVDKRSGHFNNVGRPVSLFELISGEFLHAEEKAKKTAKADIRENIDAEFRKLNLKEFKVILHDGPSLKWSKYFESFQGCEHACCDVDVNVDSQNFASDYLFSTFVRLNVCIVGHEVPRDVIFPQMDIIIHEGSYSSTWKAMRVS